jgi:hypothetical protein
MKRRMSITVMCVFVAALSDAALADITVYSGDIYALYPSATDYGAVRFKDFINAGDGTRGGNLYLQNNSSSLGSATGSDGRTRVQGDPWWTVGSATNLFKFEYRPVAGATDLIWAGATDRMTPGFSRVIDEPLKTINYISFFIQSSEGTPPTTDSITVNLTDLDGKALIPSALTFGYPPGGSAKWFLLDGDVIANGFILSGNIQLTGTIERTESDKVQIAFGNAVVPVPAAVLLGMLGLSVAGVKLRKFA